MGVLNFFQNTTGSGNDKKPIASAVPSPAFSITKVLTAGSVIIAPLATLLVKLLSKNFSPQPAQVTALIIGLLGFIALLGSADVLARASAAGSQSRSEAMSTLRDSENLITFATPIRATLEDTGVDPDVKVLAATGGGCAHYLIQKKDGSLTWTIADKVKIRGAS